MRNDENKAQGGGGGKFMSGIPANLRSYLRIVSSGASSVASTVRSAASAASAIVDRDNNDASPEQVLWAGFDKLESEVNVSRQVLLLGYRFGFQVWDVEESNNVCELVSRYDGAVSFMQITKPIASNQSRDEFPDSRPLLVICADGSFAGGNIQDGLSIPSNGNIKNGYDKLVPAFVPTAVWFYSFKTQSYVRALKFRSLVYSVRCSSRVVAVLQAAQVHCFDASTLEREYTILTNPIVTSGPGYASLGLGPLAVGPRWMAYSGSMVVLPNSGRVSPQHLTPASANAHASNGSMVVHYAKESSKQIAAGIVTLGDIGYKKLTRYYSELLPDGSSSHQFGSPVWKDQVAPNGHFPDAENVGMVIVRDVVSKSVVAQFKAHKSPISSLCFDPSGTILVTASVQGHNINVFLVVPGLSGRSSSPECGASYMHLYTLQRGLTNAVIQDISFSIDSRWILISSSRGTSHLFFISPYGSPIDALFASKNRGYNAKPTISASSHPISLSAVNRIRSGNNGWRSTVGAAVAATGRISSLSGAIASTFHISNGKDFYADTGSLREKHHILVFSPGCLTQYALRLSSGPDPGTDLYGLSTGYEMAQECDLRPVVEPIQKWNICQKQSRREREENVDIYGENGYSDNRKVFPEEMKKGGVSYTEGSTVKKDKFNFEGHHMYISEAELQMHQPRIPLWARPQQIYFQSVVKDNIKMDEEDAWEGEFEIERIPTRTIEARSKDLVPAVNHQPPEFQMARLPTSEFNNNGQILHPSHELFENGSMTGGISCVSADPSSGNIDGVMTDPHSDNEEAGGDALLMPIENTVGLVNTVDSPKLNTLLGIVNDIESSASEAHLEFVNNDIGSSKMEKQLGVKVDKFD